MMTMVTVLGFWGIGSVVFVLALAAAAAVKPAPANAGINQGHMETAEEILARLDLVNASERGLPVHAHAQSIRAH